ncbi:MAG: hypothetical protein K9M94_13945 [Spirochaetia bacterium]|nr:hypothetical protein [Spirochaetia bacterium]
MKFTRTKDLYGVDERSIETTYWQSGENQSDKLAVVLPGYIYPPDAPATFFLKLAFMKHGWDYLTVDYRYNENDKFLALDDKGKAEYLKSDQAKIGEYIIDKYKQMDLCLIGKSLGTTGILNILTHTNLLSVCKRATFMLLTPTESQKEILPILKEANRNLLYVIGDKDPYYEKGIIDSLTNEATINFKVIKNSGHVFEDKDNNLGKSVENIKDLTSFVEANIESGFLG